MNNILYWGILITLAGIIDYVVGDPKEPTHPVVLIGNLISTLEKKLNIGSHKKLKGLLLWTIVIAWTAGTVYFFQYIFSFDKSFLTFFNIWYLSTAISFKSLKDAGKKPLAFLKDDIEKARKYTSYIVGRDTEELSKKQILRAIVETEAENGIDGVIAPIFYMFLGALIPGLNPLVLVYIYKAVNTMDSMLGYTDEPYTEFGYFPAKLDDLFNFYPARIGALLYLIAGGILDLNLKNAITVFKRDRYNTPSPNAGQSESVVAGLLGIELGGSSYYFGKLHEKKPLGNKLRKIKKKDVVKTINIVLVAEILFYASFWILMITIF